VNCEVPRPHVILPSLEELVREGFSAHFVECDQYLAHAHERSRFAVEVAEILPDRSGLLEGRERRLILAGVVEEEPAERFQRGRGFLLIAELRPTGDCLLQTLPALVDPPDSRSERPGCRERPCPVAAVRFRRPECRR
jgi:hypothetical protein